MSGAQPHQVSELADIGIEPRLIPHIIAVESGVQRRTNDSDGSDALPKEDAQTIVDILDEALLVKPDQSRDRWIRILCEFSRLHGVRPRSYSLSGVSLSGEKAHKTAGSVEVWKGKQGTNRVCVKSFQLLGPETERIKQEFYREIVRWKYISHPNIIPFLGVLEGLPGLPRFCIISPWLEKGDIVEYTKKNQDANRFELLAQTARGLDHLHSLDIKHGGIHPGNILINREGDVCLADIGLMTIMTSSAAVRSSALTGAKPGCARYMAPELLKFSVLGSGEECRPSKESDVYSLGMAAFQVLSGVLPYDGIQKEPLIALEITQGRRPLRPQTDHQWLPDPIWKAIQRCWDDASQSRPSVGSLFQTFAKSSSLLVRDGNGPLSPLTLGGSTRDRENNASERSGSLGRMKGIWYYCTCRCCYE